MTLLQKQIILSPAARKLAAFKRKHKVRVLPTSALTGEGLAALKRALRKAATK